MAEYLLSVHHDGPPTELPEDVVRAIFAAVDDFNASLRAANVLVFSGGLLPPDSAIVVRAGDSVSGVMEGPAIPGDVQLGGLWVINVTTFDEAAQWAERASRACRQPVELRPFQGA